MPEPKTAVVPISILIDSTGAFIAVPTPTPQDPPNYMDDTFNEYHGRFPRGSTRYINVRITSPIPEDTGVAVTIPQDAPIMPVVSVV